MKRKRVDLLPGRFDLLGGKALALEPLHGPGGCRRIEPIAEGPFQIKAGAFKATLGGV